MATNKGATKKASKTAKPAAKSTAKQTSSAKGKAVPSKSVKPASKSAVKTVPKKAAPPKKVVAASKPVKINKSAASKKEVTKKSPAPSLKKQLKNVAKKVVKEVSNVVKKVTETAKPSKSAATTATKKATKEPVKAAAPTKKTTASESAKPEVKTLIKPIEKQVKKEPTKPTKVVVPKTSTDKSIKYEPDFTKSVLDAKKVESSGPTMRYSDNELIEFRDLINRKLDTAKKELAYLQGLITRKDESGDLDEGRYMTMEDGSMSMEREQLSQMASRQIQFIDHLEKAIMRIENKTYGICRVTGKLIDKARLRAVPHATLSIEAKQMMNR